MTELDEWRVKYSKIEVSLRDVSGYQEEIRRLNEILQARLREIEEYKARIG